MSLTSLGGAAQHDRRAGRLSGNYDLFTLSMAMFDSREADEVLRLASSAVPYLSSCTAEATYLMIDDGLSRYPANQTPIAELHQLATGPDFAGGGLVLTDGLWRWGFLLQGANGVIGCLVVLGADEPRQDQFFLLEVLCQQTSAALANALLHQSERDHGHRLRVLSDERAAANAELSATVAKLRQQTMVHEELTRVSASGSGEAGIANAIHRLTSLPVCIEDRFGNLTAWAGLEEPTSYPKQSRSRRDELLSRAARQGRPTWWADRLVSLARPRDEVLGVIALIDPDHTAGPYETFALEYGSTVLALELAHKRSLAEVELRLHRDLVDDLVLGTDEQSAYARSDALGHDLRGPHRVAVATWSEQPGDDALHIATTDALRGLRIPALVARRSGLTIAILSGVVSGEALYKALAAQLGSDTGAVGLGSRCDSPDGLPHSYSDAVRALEIRQRSRSPFGSTAFEALGMYRILDTGERRGEVEGFVREWLGALLDYDLRKQASFVQTLSQYLECGGNYDSTAATLHIHRNTLRYRLNRIREITHHDLANVDTRLNLHIATRALQVLRGSD